MSFLKATFSLIIGYVSAVLFFTVGMLATGHGLSGDYWAVLAWVAIFGFAIGSIVFYPCFFIIPKGSIFWKGFISVPVGALIGFLSLYFIYQELAVRFMYGGQAAIMAGVTFLLGCFFNRNPKSETIA